MIVYYQPATGQVMAVYSHGTTSKEWEQQGYIRGETRLPVDRDSRVVVVEGDIIAVEPSPNPVQPQPNAKRLAREAARKRLQGLDTSSLSPVLADLVELLR
jgi:hypothetical protein